MLPDSEKELLKNMELRLVRMETRMVKYQEQNMLEACEILAALKSISENICALHNKKEPADGG